jgi:glycolate oxidase FAD binding subunit
MTAPAAYSIDERTLVGTERPATPQALADLLAGLAADGRAAVPVGGGTQLALGNALAADAVAVSTAAFDAIHVFEPDDLTLSVGAGMTLATLQALLGERGQWLPIEAPHPDRATIGGLIATGWSDPRRLGHDTIRDLLIGVGSAHPSGTVTKAGGLVVKNVSGFDMMRIYHGALGTLGVIVSANFKTLPRPRAERTLLSTFPALADALAAARRVLDSRIRPSAVEVTGAGEAWTLAVRLDGRPGAVTLMATEATAAIAAPVETRDDADSRAWWQQFLDDRAGDSPSAATLRATTRPRALPDLAATLARAAGDVGAAVDRWTIAPGLGTVRAEVAEATGSAGFQTLRSAAIAAAEATTIIAAPAAWKQGIDVWGATPATIDISRALKEQFDPQRVLNPGRFAGFI